MASTSVSLGEYWEKFIAEQVESGRYESASAVIRDALRLAEDRERKLDRLRAFIAEGDEGGGTPIDEVDFDAIWNAALAKHQKSAS